MDKASRYTLVSNAAARMYMLGRVTCPMAIGTLMLIALGACQGTSVNSASLEEARAFVLKTIPIGTSRAEAFRSFQAMGPQEIESYWIGVPPDGRHTVSGYFGYFKTPALWYQRYVKLCFDKGMLVSVWIDNLHWTHHFAFP